MTETRCELLGLQDSDFEVKRAIDVFKEIEIEGTDIVPFIKAQAKTITPHSLNILMQCGNQEAMGLIDLAVDAFAGLFDPDGFLEVSKNMKYMFAIALISQLKITARDKNKHIITRKKAMLIDGVRLKYMPSIKHPLTESLLKNQNSLESRPYRKAMKNVFDEVLAHMNLPAQQFFRPKNATQIFEIAGLMDKVILATKYMKGNIDGQPHVKRMAAFADFTAELPKAGDIIYNLIDFFDAEIVFKNQLANPEIQLIFMIAVIDRMVSSDEPLSPENRLRLLYIANTHYAHDVDFEHPDLLDE